MQLLLTSTVLSANKTHRHKAINTSMPYIYHSMEGDILLLKEQIATAPQVDASIIDAMNRLAMLHFEGNPNETYEISCRSMVEARKIGYLHGEATALLHAGMAAAAQRNYAEAEDFYLRSLQIREDMGDHESAAAVQSKLGNTKLYEGKYTEALEHYTKAIAIRQTLNDEMGIADLNANSGIIHGLQGNHSQALKCYLHALVIYERQEQQSRIASTTSNMGLLYTELENYDEALSMFERALSIRRSANEIKSVADLLNNIGLVYYHQKQYNKALQTQEQALELKKHLGNKAKIASAYSNIANIYRDTERIDDALDYYTHALNLFTVANEKRGLLEAYSNLSELYFRMHDYTKTHSYVSIAIKLAEETGLKSYQKQLYQLLANVYEQEDNYRQAFHYHKLYTKLDKEISNSETSKQIAQMGMRYEMEQKEQMAEAERVKNMELMKAYTSLENEKQRSEELLNNILPEEISRELKEYGKSTARSFESVSVLFADIQGFTRISEQLSAEEIVSGIDEYFEAFDRIVERHGIEKIKTIGDAYLCAGGIPVATEGHAHTTVAVAKDFIEAIETLRTKRQTEGRHVFDFRIGIHTGPVVAGIVGIKKFAYDIWGDTVNTASRIQQHGEPNRINISEHTWQLIKDDFTCTYRGEIEAKNKGKLKMYFVE